jgi:hypothetical protein
MVVLSPNEPKHTYRLCFDSNIKVCFTPKHRGCCSCLAETLHVSNLILNTIRHFVLDQSQSEMKKAKKPSQYRDVHDDSRSVT